MRWVIALLLLVNFSVYLWGTLRPRDYRSVEYAPLEIGVIRLVGEAAGSGAESSGVIGPVNAGESDKFLESLAFDDVELAKTNKRQACGELLWFKDSASASELAETLSSAGAEAEFSEVVRQVADGYWVMIPPQADRRLARQQLAALHAADIKDTWLMPSGPFQNAVSLGLYSRSERAESRARVIKGLGFDAEVQPNYDRTVRYRVSYRTDERNAESIRAAASAKAGLTHRRIPCR